LKNVLISTLSLARHYDLIAAVLPEFSGRLPAIALHFRFVHIRHEAETACDPGFLKNACFFRPIRPHSRQFKAMVD